MRAPSSLGAATAHRPYLIFVPPVEHFHETLADVLRHLESGTEFNDITAERPLEGPFCDAMTNAGQKCHLGALPIGLNRKVRERPKMVKSNQMCSTGSFDENGKA